MEAAQKLISTRRGTIVLSVIAALIAGGLILVYVNRYRDSVKAQGAPVTVPALYVAGDRDFVVSFPGMDQLLANFKRVVPALRNTLMIPGCGHWTQQERPNEVNAAIIDFVRSLPN